jgi:hypothetical protein
VAHGGGGPGCRRRCGCARRACCSGGGGSRTAGALLSGCLRVRLPADDHFLGCRLVLAAEHGSDLARPAVGDVLVLATNAYSLALPCLTPHAVCGEAARLHRRPRTTLTGEHTSAVQQSAVACPRCNAPLQSDGDADFVGLRDQLALALLSPSSSAALHAAALDVVHTLCARAHITPKQLVGERWKEPWIDMPSLSLYTKPLVVVRCAALCTCGGAVLCASGGQPVLLCVHNHSGACEGAACRRLVACEASVCDASVAFMS